MLRRLISNFSRNVSERLVASRRKFNAPMRIWFEPTLNTPREHELARSRAIKGETVDLSRTGIAFMVNVIRVNENYLVGQDRKLNCEIDLPTGKVAMQIVARRYEKVGIHLTTEQYLIGASITRLDSDSNAAYDHFLRKGDRRGKRTRELGLRTD